MPPSPPPPMPSRALCKLASHQGVSNADEESPKDSSRDPITLPMAAALAPKDKGCTVHQRGWAEGPGEYRSSRIQPSAVQLNSQIAQNALKAQACVCVCLRDKRHKMSEEKFSLRLSGNEPD